MDSNDILKIRTEMATFWREHSKEASEEEMMLDPDAEILGREEKPEILGMLPDISGKRLLELGSGIGRYTGDFAKEAKHVITVDFMETFIEKNREMNSHFKNIDFKQADVTQLNLPTKSVDIVFSNWLFMYLADEEVRQVLSNILQWLDDGGQLYFRESCFHQSGSKARSSNPTKYRSPADYNAFIQSVVRPAEDGYMCAYEIVYCRSIQTYVRLKNNPNQICWMLKKVKYPGNEPGYKSFQEFLDKQQYSIHSILSYEMIFGKHFVSTGGKDTTVEFAKMLNLKTGERVLDVGSGIGGSAFHMAQEYGVHVLGIDLSTNMVDIAFERANEFENPRVQFEVCDATTREFAEASFDVVYSRDTILHIADKKALFQRFFHWLKPGGRLLISDYCCKEGDDWSEEFTGYVKQRGYHLVSPQAYGKILQSVGFTNVQALDKTDTFVECLHLELKRVQQIKDEFIKEFSLDDYNRIVNGWQDKVHRCGQGDQRWGLFLAQKPQ